MSLVLTRAQIRQRADRLCWQICSGSGNLIAAARFAGGNVDPITQNEDIEAVVDEMVRFADTLYLHYFSDLIAGQARYCIPQLYYIEKTLIYSPTSGKMKALAEYTTAQMPYAVPSWDTDPGSGEPTTWTMEGIGEVVLRPIPNYSAASGIEMAGLGTYEPSAWARDTDICPLVHRAHITVADGLAVRQLRGVQVDKGELQMDFRRGCGLFESEMATMTEQIRHRTGTEGRPYSAVGPLNL